MSSRAMPTDAAAVVLGLVTKLEKVGTAGWSDHDPDWWKATVGVQHLESGRRRAEEIEILYPNSMGVQWYQAPKPRAGQIGVFILHASDGALRPLGEFQILHPEDLQPLQHLAALTSKGTDALTPKGTHERMIRIVNMIPQSLSGETNQDSEPSIAVNPENTNLIVGTAAFTPAPMGGAFAPIYVSTDGGNTWALNMIAPGNAIIPGYPPIGTWGTACPSTEPVSARCRSCCGRLRVPSRSVPRVQAGSEQSSVCPPVGDRRRCSARRDGRVEVGDGRVEIHPDEGQEQRVLVDAVRDGPIPGYPHGLGGCGSARKGAQHVARFRVRVPLSFADHVLPFAPFLKGNRLAQQVEGKLDRDVVQPHPQAIESAALDRAGTHCCSG